MSTNRREFIEHVGAAAMLGAFPLAGLADLRLSEANTVAAEDWDLSWTPKLKGKKHKACFDCTEIESGFGPFRSSVWSAQYQAAGGAKPAELQTVLVLRHNAAVLALKEEFWKTYAVGKGEGVTHPITQQSSDRNPSFFTAAAGDVPAMWDHFAVPRFIERGGIVLVCNLALGHFAHKYVAKDGVSAEEAHKRIVAAVMPGAIVQPSGVLAVVRAQQEGCVYVKGA